MRIKETNKSEPLKMRRNPLQFMSEPGTPPIPGISPRDIWLLLGRHTAYRWRELELGCYTERENLSS